MAQMICPKCWGNKVYMKIGCDHCAGAGFLPDRNLTPHFLLSELLFSETAQRRGIPNVASPEQEKRLEQVAGQLELVRAQFGPIHVNSGYRCPELNKALSGSSKTSAHMSAFASDFVPANKTVTLKSIVEWIQTHMKYDQVIYEGTWVHLGILSPDGTKQRGQNLMMFAGHYYPYDAKDSRVR